MQEIIRNPYGGYPTGSTAWRICFLWSAPWPGTIVTCKYIPVPSTTKKKVPSLHPVVLFLPLGSGDFPSMNAFSLTGSLSLSKQGFLEVEWLSSTWGRKEPVAPTSCAWKCGFVFHPNLKAQEYLKRKKKKVCSKRHKFHICLSSLRQKTKYFFCLKKKQKKKFTKQAEKKRVCIFVCI